MVKIFLFGKDSVKKEIKTFFGDKAEFTNTLNNDVDVIIDSTNYPRTKKLENIRSIDKHCKTGIPVFTSSLCISVSEQSAMSKFPNRLIGIGLYDTFSNAKLIEIAPSKITDAEILKNAEKIFRGFGTNYSIVPDRVGLVFPRILSMIINEAAQVFSEKIAAKEDIDTAMKLGTNYPLGPLEWADKLGVELVYEILSALQRDFGEDRYRPHPVLSEMINLSKSFY